VASSPLGWASFWKAVGEMPIGIEMALPKTVVLVEIRETSTRDLGKIFHLAKGKDKDQEVIIVILGCPPPLFPPPRSHLPEKS